MGIIALSVAYAHSITCYQCPYGILPNEKCLNDGADPGKEHNCLNPMDDALTNLSTMAGDVIIPQSASKEKEIMMEGFATARMIFVIPRCRQNSNRIEFDT